MDNAAGQDVWSRVGHGFEQVFGDGPMFHFCIFGAQAGQLSSSKRVYITICGGCELKRPTIAKQILEVKRRKEAGLPVYRQHLIVTLCGATEVKLPTMAEEYIDLQDALRSRHLSMHEWEEALVDISTDDNIRVGSFTMCGAFEADELPEESAEIDGLALNRHIGRISEAAGKTLELGVGQKGAQRVATLRQAIAAAPV